MRYKAVIFDLDGVICQTDRYHYTAWKEVADGLGVQFDEELNNRLRGIGRLESLEILLGSYGGRLSPEEKNRCADKKNWLYQNLLKQMSPDDLSPEVKDTLDWIKARGIMVAVGSSSKNAKLILKQIGLEGYFDAVADGSDITRSKPDPEVFLKASEYLGVEPRRCLVVEDARSGIEAAQAANMDCAAIGHGTRYNLADYNLKRISGLLQIVT